MRIPVFDERRLLWRSPPPLHHYTTKFFGFCCFNFFSSDLLLIDPSMFSASSAALFVVTSQPGCTCDHGLPANMFAIAFVNGDQAFRHLFQFFPLWQNGGSVELQFCNCKTVVPLSKAWFHRHFQLSSNVLSFYV
jgi:hypothetical protein